MNTIPAHAQSMKFEQRQFTRFAEGLLLFNPIIYLRPSMLKTRTGIAGYFSSYRLFFFSALLLVLLPVPVHAQDQYQIDAPSSSVKCVVRYTVVGMYKPQFKDFQGRIEYDPRNVSKSAVTLSIDLKSLVSSHQTLDKIAKSSRLLDVQSYPFAAFKSQSVKKYKDHYYVSGLLNFHGIIKEIGFPFHAALEKKEGKIILSASGLWVLNRKDFGIYWHKWLDHGGIIVGNKVVIDWNVIATPL